MACKACGRFRLRSLMMRLVLPDFCCTSSRYNNEFCNASGAIQRTVHRHEGTVDEAAIGEALLDLVIEHASPRIRAQMQMSLSTFISGVRKQARMQLYVCAAPALQWQAGTERQLVCLGLQMTALHTSRCLRHGTRHNPRAPLSPRASPSRRPCSECQRRSASLPLPCMVLRQTPAQ